MCEYNDRRKKYINLKAINNDKAKNMKVKH